MPRTRHPNRRHDSTAIEPYPSLHQPSQAPALQLPPKDSLIIFSDSDSVSQVPTPGAGATTGSCPTEVLEEISQPWPRVQAPKKRPGCQSAERPGGNSQSVLLKPRPFGKPHKEVHRTYTQEFKLQVLSFWIHHKIPIGPTTFRSPTEREVAARYLVPRTTIQKWRKPEAMDLIVNRVKGTRKASGVCSCQWPEMEEQLYNAYRIWCDEQKSVRHSWLHLTARAAFLKTYSTIDVSIFVFSSGWFVGFLAHNNINVFYGVTAHRQVTAQNEHPTLKKSITS